MPRFVTDPATRTRWAVAAAGALAVAVGALLAVGAFLGLYVRPTSDDWCAAWKARDMGVFGITRDFYETQNGRVANAFVSGVVYSHGLLGQRILPALLVLTLTGGLLLAARSVLRVLGWRAPWPALLAAALLVEALLFYAGTRPYQVLLWAPGTISHTLPSVIAVWSVPLVLWARRGGRTTTLWAVVAYALAMGCVMGTLSEPFTVVSGVFVGVAALLLIPRLRRRDWFPFTWSAAWCVGLVIGFAVLYTSPGARWRRAQTPPQPSPLSGKELRAEYHDWVSVWTSVADSRTYLAALAVGLLLGLVMTGRTPARLCPSGRGRAAALLVLPAPLVALSSFGVVVGLRMGYGAGGWTYGRAWANFLFPMLLVLTGYGLLAGRALARTALTPGRAWSAPALLVAGAVAIAGTAAGAVGLLPTVQGLTKDTVTRTSAWDHQDKVIRAEVSEGATEVTYHPLRVRNLAEPFMTRTYARDWAAACVSHYYHVDRITKPVAARPSTPPVAHTPAKSTTAAAHPRRTAQHKTEKHQPDRTGGAGAAGR